MPFIETMPTRTSETNFYILSQTDEKAIASNWYYYALFSLARIKNSRATPDWISRRLGITPAEANNALICLVKLGLIEVRNGRMLLLKQNFESETDLPSSVLRKFHKQNLKRAADSIDRDSLHERDMTSMTLAFNDKDMKLAKDYINKFRHRFCKKFESSNGTDVYTLGIQFFPQTIKPKRGQNDATDLAESK